MEASGAESQGLLDQILNCLDDVAALGLKRHDEKQRSTLRSRSVPVFLEVFGPVLGCFSRARLKHSKTLQNTRGPFGGPDLARLGPRKHPKTRRVGVESKRSTPLAFSSLAARDEEATLSGRRHRRSKTTPAPPLPPTLQGHAAAPSRCPAAAPSHCPAAAPSR
jgi:hypothetical protein